MSMVSIGIRCSANEIFYAITDGSVEDPNLTEKNKIKAPASYSLPCSLAWFREQFLLIFQQYKIKAVCIRVTEPMARLQGGAAKEGFAHRCHIEGVIAETAASLGLPVIMGPMATLSSAMGTTGAKKYKEIDEFRGIKGWEKLNSNYREATLAAVAALSVVKD